MYSPVLRRRSFMTLAAVFAVAVSALPANADGPASLGYLPPGLSVWFVSADGSTIVGVEESASGQSAFVLRGGVKTTLTLGGILTFPSGVSGDGTKVVGSAIADDGNFHAFAWNAGDAGATPLLPGSLASTANAVSADGSTIVGEDFTDTGSVGFVLKNGTKTVLSNGGPSTHPMQVSSNGSVVVGSTVTPTGSYDEAFFWRPGDAAPILISLPGLTPSMATLVSADGSTVVGSKTVDSNTHAFVWKVASNTASFVDLGGGDTTANSVSANGSTVVGDGFIGPNNIRGFAWRNGSTTVLAPPAGRQYSTAYRVSADGSRVVGSALNDAQDTIDYDSRDIVVWEGTNGPKFLKDLLTQAGVQVGPQRLRAPTALSSDGTLIAGDAFLRTQGSDGSFTDQFSAFSAVLPLTPPPPPNETPAEMIRDLIDEVISLRLPHGTTVSLVVKATVALVAVQLHANVVAVVALNDFVREVRSQRGKKIPAAAADDLIADANEIIAKLRR